MSWPLSGGDIQKMQSKPCNIFVLPTSFIGKYNDELQIKFTFRSDPMIFDQVIALGL
jgi:hypothetical protein